ncbi:hypothetical protein D5085_01650 [Ectothiorhodospiraceae bacterium BW-2]|nr:hypothetical protein D5085_01650 [Ectothiorhodospiraceae bacterium BW-2]
MGYNAESVLNKRVIFMKTAVVTHIALVATLLTTPVVVIAEPRWVSEPNYDTHYNGASSCVNEQQAPTAAMAEQMALTYARRELAQSLAVQVETSFEQMLTATGSPNNSTIKRAVKDHIQIETSALLRGSRVAAKWRDRSQKQICVWVVLQQQQVEQMTQRLFAQLPPLSDQSL